jgi:hypothetical protein
MCVFTKNLIKVETNKKMLQDYLEAGGGSISENGTITFPPNTPDPLKEWAHYIVDYNQTTIEENFKLAWQKFGKVRLYLLVKH